MDAQHGIARAKLAHSGKVMQGILSLSQTALKGAQMIEAHNQEQAEINETLDAMGFGADDRRVLPRTPSMLPPTSTPRSVPKVKPSERSLKDLQDGSVAGASVAHQLQQGSAYKSLQGINGNILSARAAHGVFLEEAVNALPERHEASDYGRGSAADP